MAGPNFLTVRKHLAVQERPDAVIGFLRNDFIEYADGTKLDLRNGERRIVRSPMWLMGAEISGRFLEPASSGGKA